MRKLKATKLEVTKSILLAAMWQIYSVLVRVEGNDNA